MTEKPHALLDYILKKAAIKNDKHIAKLLNTSPAVISKIRNNIRNPSPQLVLSIYDHTDLSIEEIRKLIRGKV